MQSSINLHAAVADAMLASLSPAAKPVQVRVSARPCRRGLKCELRDKRVSDLLAGLDRVACRQMAGTGLQHELSISIIELQH